MKRLLPALPALVLAALLGACSSTPPLQFYTLGPLPPPPAQVPEPASMSLIGLGALGLAAIRRRK